MGKKTALRSTERELIAILFTAHFTGYINNARKGKKKSKKKSNLSSEVRGKEQERLSRNRSRLHHVTGRSCV